MTKTLRALRFAEDAHIGQVDKGGRPYIFHPKRVALAVADKGEHYFITALLHDTVEDCGVTPEQIATLFGYKIAKAVMALTKREGESYLSFIQRCGENPIAVAVKIADIQDNLDPERFAHLDDTTKARLRLKYIPALAYLKELQA